MAHCPGCGNTVSTARDVTFIDMGADGFLSGDMSKASRYYVMSCGQCNRMLGGGVASKGSG
jgi:predicted nucleic-acid-binding Zn-ribbon protein